jgi:hypothetical protein
MPTSSHPFVPAPLLLLALAAAGCAQEPDDDPNATAAALVSDNYEIESLEGDLEGSLEVALSGAVSEDSEVTADTESDAAEAARANAGVHLQPAGCVTSTREGNVVTHVLERCTGPRGRSLDGTVVSTWSRTERGVDVVHQARGFSVAGATVDHDTHISYEHADGVTSRHRTSSTVGVTARGRAIDHAAEFTNVFDPASSCFERNGSSQTTIGDRTWSREVVGLRRCGGRFECPSSGTIRFSGPRGEGSIEISGAGLYDLTVNGRTDSDRQMLWCSDS